MLSEARDEYFALEMARASRRLVDDVLEVQPGMQVVITADSQTDWRVVESNARAIYAADAIPVVVYYHTQPRPQMEPPSAVAAALAQADIWIEHAVSYIMYTHAWQKALDAGALYCELGGMDVDGMVRCIGKQDINKLAEMGDIIVDLLTDCDNFRITSELGTDVVMSNVGCQVGIFKMKTNPEKIPIMLAGQVSWLPVEESLNGKIVADGVLYPPSEVGILQETVEFTVKDGRVVDISGGKEARLLQDWLGVLNDNTMERIAHVSLGFNPGIPVPTGRVMEDERAFGDVDFGWGAWVGRPAAGHYDITCRNVSYWAGDMQLLDKGVFVHPDLAEICRQMGVPRH
jgi:leucyl aminopeptidase (aminopeptidase T)